MRLLLLHGAWAGPWVWDSFLTAWGDRSPAKAVVLRTAPDETDADQVTRIVAALDADDEPAVLIGHSGGAALALTATHLRRERIRGLVSLAGITLPPGGSLPAICEELDLGPRNGIIAFVNDTPGGTVVPPEAAVAVFFHDIDPAVAVEASHRLVPMSHGSLGHRPIYDGSTVGTLPHLYVEATLVRSLPPVLQRHLAQASGATEIVTLECGTRSPWPPPRRCSTWWRGSWGSGRLVPGEARTTGRRSGCDGNWFWDLAQGQGGSQRGRYGHSPMSPAAHTHYLQPTGAGKSRRPHTRQVPTSWCGQRRLRSINVATHGRLTPSAIDRVQLCQIFATGARTAPAASTNSHIRTASDGRAEYRGNATRSSRIHRARTTPERADRNAAN